MTVRLLSVAFVALALSITACGGEDGDEPGGGPQLSGRVETDGSSTVGPFTQRAAELFRRENRNVEVTVGVSGTGGGFERFCRGETDLSNASRAIDDEERQACENEGIEYVEFQVANDALTVVVNRDNTWASCLTVDELRKIWQPSSNVESWNEVRRTFPDERLTLYGAGTDSGTFDYFTEAIVGEEGESRSDYSATEDDNVTVRGVSGDKGALGYFGYSYFEENQDQLKALAIDAGDGCVKPSVQRAQSGAYKPLSRPLFVYAKTTSFQRPEVEAFVRYMLDNAKQIAAEARFVPLTDEQLAKAKDAFRAAGGGASG